MMPFAVAVWMLSSIPWDSGLQGEESSGGCLRKELDESGRKFRKVSGWL